MELVGPRNCCSLLVEYFVGVYTQLEGCYCFVICYVGFSWILWLERNEKMLFEEVESTE